MRKYIIAIFIFTMSMTTYAKIIPHESNRRYVTKGEFYRWRRDFGRTLDGIPQMIYDKVAGYLASRSDVLEEIRVWKSATESTTFKDKEEVK